MICKAKYDEERRLKLQQKKPLVYEKVLKFEEKLARGETIALIQMQYSYSCNMKCKHCSVETIRYQNDNRRKLTPEDVKEIADEMDAMGLARFEVNGGEPFVVKEYDEVIKAIGPERFYINSVTNGYLLDDFYAEHVASLGVDRIQVSIDSLDRDSHDAFRRCVGAHRRACGALFSARDIGLDVFLSTTVTKERLYSQELLDFIRYWNDEGIGVFLTFAKPVGGWEGKFDSMVEESDLPFIDQLQSTYNVFSHLTPSHGIEMGCLAFRGLFSMTPYGDVLPCQYIFVSIGNIFEEPLKDILERGMRLKPFKTKLCPIAMDKEFVNKYIVPTYHKHLPVPYTEIFGEGDFDAS